MHGREVCAPGGTRVRECCSVSHWTQLDAAAFELLADEIPTSRLARGELLGMAPVDLLARTPPAAPSKGEVRRTPTGYYVNQESLAGRGDAADWSRRPGPR